MRIILIITCTLFLVTSQTVTATEDLHPVSEVKDKKVARIAAVGDILLGRGVGTRIRKYGED